MKITRQSVLAASTLAIGAFLGASALVALADATWTAAPATPPNSNVSAPVNVGAAFQTKNGNLQINGVLGVVGNLIIATGTPVAGSTLVSVDNLGTVAWQAPAIPPTGTLTFANPGTYVWTAPAGVTHASIKMWGGGGSGGYATTAGHTNGGGGGAGAYAANPSLSVTPGGSYILTVGSGRIESNGTPSSITTNSGTITAGAGNCGENDNYGIASYTVGCTNVGTDPVIDSGNYSTGGAGGTVTPSNNSGTGALPAGWTGIAGQRGYSGFSSFGGKGGDSPNGGIGGTGSGATNSGGNVGQSGCGLSGGVPGAGGGGNGNGCVWSGNSSNTTNAHGGAGTNGEIIISY